MQHCLVAETQGVLSHCKMGVIGLTQWRVLIIQHFVRLKIHSCHDLTLQDQCSTQHYTNAAQSTAESCSSCSASWSKLSILNNWNQPIVQTALPIILPTAHCRPQNRSTQARTNAKCLQYTGNECITSDSSMLIHGLSAHCGTHGTPINLQRVRSTDKVPQEIRFLTGYWAGNWYHYDIHHLFYLPEVLVAEIHNWMPDALMILDVHIKCTRWSRWGQYGRM